MEDTSRQKVPPVEVSKMTEESPTRPSPQQNSVIKPPIEKPKIKIISYAGFWKRVAASIIDTIILTVGCFIIGFVFRLIWFAGGTHDTAALFWQSFFLGIIIMWLYYAVMESSPKQATLGKMALGIKVTDLNGRKIDFGKATGRYLGKFISSIILGIGYIMVAFTWRKQGLHDIMAGCLVVNRDLEIATSEAKSNADSIDGQTKLGKIFHKLLVGDLIVFITIFIIVVIIIFKIVDSTKREEPSPAEAPKVEAPVAQPAPVVEDPVAQPAFVGTAVPAPAAAPGYSHSVPVAGKIYHCIDRNGNSTITDSPQDGMKNCVLMDSHRGPAPPAYPHSYPEPAPAPAP